MLLINYIGPISLAHQEEMEEHSSSFSSRSDHSESNGSSTVERFVLVCRQMNSCLLPALLRAVKNSLLAHIMWIKWFNFFMHSILTLYYKAKSSEN